MSPPTTRSVVDLSHRLDAATLPYPGDPPVEFVDIDVIGREGLAGKSNASAIHTSLHCGTHMDAPFHFCSEGARIDQVPLDRCLGPALLIRLIDVQKIDVDHLISRRDRLQGMERVIFDTSWYRRWGSDRYFTSHPVITVEAAQFLIQNGVRLVGVDFPSVDRAPHETHRELLGNDVVILENLTNLSALPSDDFDLIALPLRIGARDGSPVRAVAVVER